jgi:hypothetical protein
VKVNDLIEKVITNFSTSSPDFLVANNYLNFAACQKTKKAEDLTSAAWQSTGTQTHSFAPPPHGGFTFSGQSCPSINECTPG